MTDENDATKKTLCWTATALTLGGTLLIFSIIGIAWVIRDSVMIRESKNRDLVYPTNVPMVPMPSHPMPQQAVSRRMNSAASSHLRVQSKRPVKARIVGGTTTEQNDYPYMVALNLDGMNDGKPICGGVLITPRIILTAAHCVFQVSSADLGRYDLRNDDGVVHQKLNWSNKRVHPNYNYHTADNDIGLIKLTEPYYAPHYAVPYNSQSMPSDLTVIGWGRTSFNGAQPNILRRAEVNGVSDSYCTQRYSSYNSSSMICASAPGRDSCQGDSGGPLFERDTSFIVGIVSFGYDCADPNFPGVYARVNSFEAWIDETVCDDLNPQDCDHGTIKNQLYQSKLANMDTPLVPMRKRRRRSASVSPTRSPILPPTSKPANYATELHTNDPTMRPSISPTARPTLQPVMSPTQPPILPPTSNPTNFPTKLPTSDPSTPPTMSPSDRPTLQPTKAQTTFSPSLAPNVATPTPTTIPTWLVFAPIVSSTPSKFTNGVQSAMTLSPIAPVDDTTPGPTTSTLNSVLFDVKSFEVLLSENFNHLSTRNQVPDECQDKKFWIGPDNYRLDCKWVKQRVHRRCKNYADYCPSVCKKKVCRSYYESK